MTRAPLVDYHCHLDLYRDPKNVFAATGLRDVEILAVTTTPLAWKHNCDFARNTPNVRIGLGLHPQLIGQAVADIEAFAKLIPHARFIGEVGLDAGPRYYKSLDKQQSILGDVLELCVAHGPKIVSMHCVRAFKQVFALLDAHWQPDAGTIVLHWFSGSRSDVKKAVQRGCFFSINAQMESSPNGRRAVLEIPIERMLTETDGPFTERSASEPRLPGDVSSAIQLIASLKHLSVEHVQDAIWRNVQDIERQHRKDRLQPTYRVS
jgi:TatD DNase family protein